jgi:hypothetical protein
MIGRLGRRGVIGTEIATGAGRIAIGDVSASESGIGIETGIKIAAE